MKTESCSICGSKELRIVRARRELEYLSCIKCGHCIKGGVASASSVLFADAQDKYYGEASLLKVEEPHLFEFELLHNRYSVLGRYLDGPKDVIEVGPGSGHVLAWLLENGHTTTAVEHSPVLAQALMERLSTEVTTGEFETLPFQAGKFDAFCSFHVIEHVSDPLLHLSKAFEVVKPGGLAFVATPNARSWQQIAIPSLSPNFDSAHLCVFSPQSLRLLAEAAGWSVVDISTPESTSNWIRVLTKAFRRVRNLDEEATAGQFAQGRSTLTKMAAPLLRVGTAPLRSFQSALGYGNEVFAIFRKSESNT